MCGRVRIPWAVAVAVLPTAACGSVRQASQCLVPSDTGADRPDAGAPVDATVADVLDSAVDSPSDVLSAEAAACAEDPICCICTGMGGAPPCHCGPGVVVQDRAMLSIALLASNGGAFAGGAGCEHLCLPNVQAHAAPPDAGECAWLAACCPTIPGLNANGCWFVADEWNPSPCAQATGYFQAQGFCLLP